MKRMIISIFILLTLSFGSISNIKRLQWIDPYGREPMKHSKWHKQYVDQKEPTKIVKVYEKIIKRRQNLVDIIVNAGVYTDIISELNVFTQDLINAGYSIQLDTMSGMSHTTLRNHLASLPDLVGAIFIGETPIAWFETNGFGSWEEYPHDLYFCDLNGTYIDADANGIYDDHTGNVAPEIWVGRIYARNLTWDNEIRLLKRYFEKNHLYRVDSLSLPQRALSFVEDDWSYWTTCGLDLIYSDVVVINDEYQTTASEYRNQLNQGYEWIHICAHSSPWGHTFKYGYSGYKGTVFNYEIFTLEPHALFYNLFACSGTRFVEENHSAGWYIFIDPYGLLAVGSTKTGSMLEFDDFYGPIGQQNMCIGDAFKHWFTLWGEYDWDWFYGMNILGDPTLKPQGQIELMSTKKTHLSIHTLMDWPTPEIVAPDSESDAFPKIIENNDDKVWVVWESGRSYTNGRSEIYGAYHDAGTWSNAMNIGPHVYWDYCPVIGTDNQNRPVAVWAGFNDGQYDLYYSIYTGSWSSRQLVHTSDPGYDIKPAMIKDNNNNLWTAWESRRNINLDIYASYFNGSVWTSPEQVTAYSTDETTPVMAIDSLDKPWIFFCRRFENSSEIWGSYYTGSQWLASGPISGSQQRAYHPACAVDEDGLIRVVWQSLDTGNPDIFASYFNGNTWSSPIQVTTSTESDLFPSLITHTSGVVCCVYQSKTGGDWNIYYTYCVDSTWSSPEIVANLVGADINPQITCSDSNELWICWQSYSTGNWEIMVSHRYGYGIIEQENRTTESVFSVSSTIFSKRLKIITMKAYQEIKIYDIKGSPVKTLSSNQQGHAIWTPGQLPDGAYFICVGNKNTTSTKKVVFLR
jgi:hypothetical protein